MRITKIWKKLTLKNQILIFFAIAVVIIVFFVGLTLFYSIAGIFENESVKKVIMEKDVVLMLWIISSVLIVIAFVGGSFFANSITRPLKKLETTMSHFDENTLNNSILIEGSYEINELSNHFQKMIGSINLLMDENHKKEKELRLSELKTLHSQINPHFIYNTLDTIIWLSELGDTEKVVLVTKAMARFFRLSLRGGSEFTTIREELEHVKQYLLIQKQRYQEKLEYEIDYEEDILDIEIPKIILQPLVENSIYHGIRNIQKGGVIKISAKTSSVSISTLSEKINNIKIIELTVKDNGKGFDTSVEMKKANEVRLGGVGLLNVDKRIKLYYGDEFGLKVESAPNKGSLVTIILSNVLKKQ